MVQTKTVDFIMTELVDKIKCVDTNQMDGNELIALMNEIEESKDVIVCVGSANMGFTWGVSIRQIVEPFPGTLTNEILLNFTKDQSPCTFKQLSQYFNSPRNIEKLEYASLPKPREEHHYSY